MMRLKTFAVFSKNGEEEMEQTLFIHEGFTWMAAVFTFLWTLYHRMWLPTLGIVAAMGVAFWLTFAGIIPPQIGALLRIGILIFVGFNAYYWREKKLLKTGHRLVGITHGNDETAAKLRYFDYA